MKLYVDACLTGVGCALFNVDDDNSEQLIAYASSKLQPCHFDYFPTELEGLALLFGVVKFEKYISAAVAPVMVMTDHKLLYIEGKFNYDADVQSRLASEIDTRDNGKTKHTYSASIVNRLEFPDKNKLAGSGGSEDSLLCLLDYDNIEESVDENRVDYQLHPALFQLSMKILGPCDLELFANHNNNLLPKYRTKKDDTFLEDWSVHKGYANPPFSLLGEVLHQIKQQRSITVVCHPFLPDAAWWPLWEQLLDPDPVLLPRCNNTFLHKAKSGLASPPWPAVFVSRLDGSPKGHDDFGKPEFCDFFFVDISFIDYI
eukprot:Pgem_evm1s23